MPKKKKKNVLYILWYQDPSIEKGWPTLNDDEHGNPFNPVYESRESAVAAWKRHNKVHPEDQQQLSVRKFVEA